MWPAGGPSDLGAGGGLFSLHHTIQGPKGHPERVHISAGRNISFGTETAGGIWMAFAIMRAKKLSTMGSVAAALQHCYRERETPNADQDRTPENQNLAARSSDEAMGMLREKLPEKRRKDAVLAVEYVMTASPEWWDKASFDQQESFLCRSYEWLQEKYGRENIITATIHRDELTPHLSAFVVPITADGRLSAKEFIGNKTKMSRDQTTFAESVRELGLERGIEGSLAKHQRVKSHYASIQQVEKAIPQISEEELKPKKVKGESLAERVFGAMETPKGVASRLTDKIDRSVRPIVEKASVSAQNERRAKEMQMTAVELRKRLKALQEPFKGLSKGQITQVVKLASDLKAENEKKRKEKSMNREVSRDQGWSR